jgi:hypothetical protein
VRLVEVLERRARAVARVRGGREGLDLPRRGLVDDSLEPHVVVVGERPARQNLVHRAEREILDLLLRHRDHRDVRVGDGYTHGHPLAKSLERSLVVRKDAQRNARVELAKFNAQLQELSRVARSLLSTSREEPES